MHDLLKQYKHAAPAPLSSCLLQTAQHKTAVVEHSSSAPDREKVGPWRSPRLKKKNSGGKTIVKLAQDLVVKKCGAILEEENLEAMTLHEYLDLYKDPITDKCMEAILKLSEVATQKKKKKKKSVMKQPFPG
jgi:hypothetical protein